MTKTRRAGFSKKRRRGGRKTVKRRSGRKTMKRRGRKRRTRVKRRGRKRSSRRRRGAGTTHHVKKDGSVTGSWEPATAKAYGQPDPIGHHDDIEVKQPWGKQSYRPWTFEVTGSQGAVKQFKDEETKAGSAKNTGGTMDIYNFLGYYPDRGPDTSKMTRYMDKKGYGSEMKNWLQGPPNDNK